MPDPSLSSYSRRSQKRGRTNPKRTKRSVRNVKLTSTSWGPKHLAAWQKLKDAVATSVTRAVYDPTKQTCVWTDASNRFWSGVITQCEPGEQDKPKDEQRHTILVCSSGGFKKSALNWHTKCQEAFPR